MHAIIVRMSGEKAVPVSVPMPSSVVAFLLRRTESDTSDTSDARPAGRCLKRIRGRALANARWISDPLSNQVDLQNPLIHTTYLIHTLCVGSQSCKRSISSGWCVPFVLSHTHRTSDRGITKRRIGAGSLRHALGPLGIGAYRPERGRKAERERQGIAYVVTKPRQTHHLL